MNTAIASICMMACLGAPALEDWPYGSADPLRGYGVHAGDLDGDPGSPLLPDVAGGMPPVMPHGAHGVYRHDRHGHGGYGYGARYGGPHGFDSPLSRWHRREHQREQWRPLTPDWYSYAGPYRFYSSLSRWHRREHRRRGPFGYVYGYGYGRGIK